jgi:hypothetical protein
MNTFEALLNEDTDVMVFYPAKFDNQDFEDNYELNVVYIQFYRQDMLMLTSFLKHHCLIRANNSIDATVVDNLGAVLRFNVNYFLTSPSLNCRFVIST